MVHACESTMLIVLKVTTTFIGIKVRDDCCNTISSPSQQVKCEGEVVASKCSSDFYSQDNSSHYTVGRQNLEKRSELLGYPPDRESVIL